MVMALPFAFALIIACWRVKLDAFKERIGNLYEEFKQDSIRSICYWSVFLIRRNLFATLLILLRDNTSQQNSYFFALNLIVS